MVVVSGLVVVVSSGLSTELLKQTVSPFRIVSTVVVVPTTQKFEAQRLLMNPKT